MASMTSRAGKYLQAVLARRGLVLVSPPWRFGVDPFADIAKLSDKWRSRIGVFFDVGANDGKTAANALRWFPAADVFAFEPHPITFGALSGRFGGNRRCHAANLALGTEVGTAEMFEYDLSVLNSLKPNAPYARRFGKEARRVAVQCTTLDRFCTDNGIDMVDVLKIDTEGFEVEVLKGAQDMLARRRIRFIYAEFNDIRTTEHGSGGGLIPIDELIRPFGFRFVASYNDYIVAEDDLFAVSNALFALPPLAT